MAAPSATDTGRREARNAGVVQSQATAVSAANAKKVRQEPGRGDGGQRGEPPPRGLLGGAFEEPGEGEREQRVERVGAQLGAAQDELARERDDEAASPAAQSGSSRRA